MTWSILARDPGSGELGIAVQSRFFAAGRIVPWIEAGVGAVASQSFTNPAYGHECLRLLRSGMDPQTALESVRAGDSGEALRQVAILDVRGRAALHTGARCVSAAGHAIGADCCAAANMMTRNTVWDAMVRAFENARGELAVRLFAAMQAAEREGGDLRGKQAAALVVVSGKPSGIPSLDRIVDLRVDDHPEPVAEIDRLLRYSRAHERANRALARLGENDLSGALADLDASCGAFPAEPEFLFRRALVLLAIGREAEARDALGQAHGIHPGWSELALRFADAGVIPIPRSALELLTTGLSGKSSAMSSTAPPD
ncbi:MAG TPA: DUF1028 domain-containing protein [Terriglobales bacterium]|nr:DUF1028 domain-containing protein [Terriglobales bacterium]